MKKTLLILSAAAALSVSGQGFVLTPANWPLPNGGKLMQNITYGFDGTDGYLFGTENTGSQGWELNDINGDGKPDLVIASQIQGGKVISFSPGSAAYWKVHLNTGNGFSPTAVNWAVPTGGLKKNGTDHGFNALSSSSADKSDDPGSQNWATMDINGDGKPDLVVTGQLQTGSVTCFSPGNGPYWKVYLNTGSGFSGTATNWQLPAGGKIIGGTGVGYHSSYGVASPLESTGSQTWWTADIDGDKKEDLVVTAQLQNGKVTSFSPASAQYWKVYKNTGTGFSTTATNWLLPNGGNIHGGTTYGFDNLSGMAFSSYDTGSQSWITADINGDGKPDLVVVAQLVNGHVTSFSPGSSQYWKIFLNNGSGFATSPSNWSLPAGGRQYQGIDYGFEHASGSADDNQDPGSQSWDVQDMDNDKLPDLIVTGQVQNGKATVFSPASASYWKIYKNTGTGFATTALNWSVPPGGELRSNTTYGFRSTYGWADASFDTGSQTWSMIDINGDGKMELVITAQKQNGNVTSFSPESSQYWKYYASEGTLTGLTSAASGETSLEVWPNPSGGVLNIHAENGKELVLINELGQEVLRTAVKDSPVTLKDIAAGLYFVRCGTSVKKVIVH